MKKMILIAANVLLAATLFADDAKVPLKTDLPKPLFVGTVVLFSAPGAKLNDAFSSGCLPILSACTTTAGASAACAVTNNCLPAPTGLTLMG